MNPHEISILKVKNHVPVTTNQQQIRATKSHRQPPEFAGSLLAPDLDHIAHADIRRGDLAVHEEVLAEAAGLQLRLAGLETSEFSTKYGCFEVL